MADLKSKIILCKGINLDKEYKNVLSYSESQMVSLCQSKAIASASDYQFIREHDSIYTNFTYSQCLQANYIAFQNKDYSNKWFFAFIDEVIYQGEENTEIKFTVDSWSTWFDYWTKKTCYVIREHTNDDTVGKNTVHENIDTGKFVNNSVEKFYDTEQGGFDEMCYFLQATQDADGGSFLEPTTDYGGIPFPYGTYATPSFHYLKYTLELYQQNYGQNMGDVIYGCYIVPKAIVQNLPDTSETPVHLLWEGQSTPTYLLQTITKPTTVDGYTPKNKKLLTGQFCCLNVSNNSGRINTYYYELFNEIDEYPNQCLFNVSGVPTVGGSIKCVPNNYKQKNETGNEDEAIYAGKFPTLAWSDNAYINWLTQQSVNNTAISLSNTASAVGQIGLGVLTGNPASIGTGSLSLLSEAMRSGEQTEIVPSTVRGNTNCGDINTCDGTNTFYFMKASVTAEFAKRIDDYLSRYGYKTLELKLPNITGRTYWNYIEIAQSEEIGTGDVPPTYMDEINNACRKGVTIWHNHANVGNFALNNTIVT